MPEPIKPSKEPGREPERGVAFPAGRVQREQTQRIPKWLERGELFLRVILRLYLGLALCYAPWSRAFWDQNPIFLHYPWLGVLAMHGAVRGFISGLGLLNLWYALEDAIHHGEE